MSDGRPTVRQRRLGLELRQLRHGLGWTLSRAAERLDMRLSSLSKIETGRQRVRTRELPAFFDAYGLVDPARREAITHLAREALKRNWWQGFEGVVSDPYADYLSLEGSASEIAVFNPLVVPGLLQTQTYARELTEASRVWSTLDEVDRFVELRMKRQELLTGEHPPRYWVILSELSLRQEVGGKAVLRDQVAHLIDTAVRLPHVTVQVVPYDAGAHSGSDGGFALMRFAVGSEVVCLESMRASLYLEEPGDIAIYAATLDHLKSSALSVRDSMAFMKTLCEDLER
ncbi:helix-turn-helix transcriptional regulator [Embleya sp. NPDC005971]|uniref:helix-turn-helix domain-containing protein n=1 Tax=Embleya sp. NPDC005971 TaxID=3156724 RepID=UPI00340865B0